MNQELSINDYCKHLFFIDKSTPKFKVFICEQTNIEELEQIINISNFEYITESYEFLCQRIINFYIKEPFNHLSIWNLKEKNSAKLKISFAQKFILILILIMGFYNLINDYNSFLFISLITINAIIFFEVCFKLLLFTLGYLSYFFPKDINKHKVNKKSEYPIYTILIPIYKESNMVPSINLALQELDYPIDKLDIKILVEEDDLETINAVNRLMTVPYQLLMAPISKPRTKPKALNLGLLFAKGEFLTIYDAEDKPEKLQLKHAINIFRETNAKCLQAKLNFYNSEQNLLTKMFSIEYAILFNYLLKGLSILKMPIPLGGNSNHFHTQSLIDACAWDAYNVTEDADLGIRLTKNNNQTILIDSFTYEEATFNVKNWLGQRSRWIKGYYQTYLVNLRNPLDSLNKLGIKNFLAFNFFIGFQSMSFLFKPIIFLLCFMNFENIFLKNIILTNFFISIILNFITPFLAMPKSYNFIRKLLLSFIYNFYFFLHVVAALRAIYELIFKPYYWFKTPHGQKNN